MSTIQPPGTTELPDQFDVQGHRGARGLSPENTLPSFETALDLMVDTIELDLHLSADDEPIVWHDPYVLATKCRSDDGDQDRPGPDDLRDEDPSLKVRNLTAKQLTGFQCIRNPGRSRFPDQSASLTALAGDNFGIVNLERFFDFVDEYADSDLKSKRQRENAANIRFNLELKRVVCCPQFIDDGFDGENPGMLERRIIDIIEARDLRHRVMLQCFDHRAIWAAKKIAPWLEIAALDSEPNTDPAQLFARGASVWTLKYGFVDAERVAAAHTAGLKIVPWTVNTPQDMVRLIELGVDGIITDRPDLIVAWRGENNGRGR